MQNEIRAYCRIIPVARKLIQLTGDQRSVILVDEICEPTTNLAGIVSKVNDDRHAFRR